MWNDCPICGTKLAINSSYYLECYTRRQNKTRSHYWFRTVATPPGEFFALIINEKEYWIYMGIYMGIQYTSIYFDECNIDLNYVVLYKYLSNKISKLLLLI